ncbi:MAG: alpha/beta hydrolase [Verrucomicrobiales bacterium]|nr:alpha/beta hydrolase [Verrucomicrobiales bacterium]
MRVLIAPFFVVFGCLTGFAQEPKRVDLRSENDVVYAKFGDREVQLDWFRPANEETLPGIVLIHGGGWIGGKRESFESTARDLAHHGYMVANISYRLATEAKFPGAVLDCKAAVRWMRANAGRLGVDSERIAAIGGSAGGHLAAMVATTSGDPDFEDQTNHPAESDALQAAIIMGSGVDQVARVHEAKSGSIKNCVIFFGGEYSEVPEIYAKGSPITHLSQSTPPILMLDGEKDRPGERYVEFRSRLDALGVTNEFQMIPGAKHGEWGKATFRPAFVGAMTAFLDGVFSGKN